MGTIRTAIAADLTHGELRSCKQALLANLFVVVFCGAASAQGWEELPDLPTGARGADYFVDGEDRTLGAFEGKLTIEPSGTRVVLTRRFASEFDRLEAEIDAVEASPGGRYLRLIALVPNEDGLAARIPGAGNGATSHVRLLLHLDVRARRLAGRGELPGPGGRSAPGRGMFQFYVGGLESFALAGVQVERLAPVSTTLTGQLVLDAAHYGEPPRDPSQDAVNEAGAELVGAPGALGKLTVVIPGMTAAYPSPGFMFRLARYSDFVLIVYLNRSNPKLRALSAIDSISVPAELEGRIWAIGSPELNVQSYQQTSDWVLEALEQARDLNPFGFPVLEAEVTFVAHSQGGLAAALTRRRLEAAGFPKAVRRVVTLGTPLTGLDVPCVPDPVVQFGTALVDRNLRRAVGELRADEIAAQLGATGPLVDLGLWGSADWAVSQSAARARTRRFAVVEGETYTHLGLIRSYQVVDRMVELLASGP